jgi:hypothetical protein
VVPPEDGEEGQHAHYSLQAKAWPQGRFCQSGHCKKLPSSAALYMADIQGNIRSIDDLEMPLVFLYTVNLRIEFTTTKAIFSATPG